jgi:hypothetical protein
MTTYLQTNTTRKLILTPSEYENELVESKGGEVVDSSYVSTLLSVLKSNDLYEKCVCLVGPNLGVRKNGGVSILFDASGFYNHFNRLWANKIPTKTDSAYNGKFILDGNGSTSIATEKMNIQKPLRLIFVGNIANTGTVGTIGGGFDRSSGPAGLFKRNSGDFGVFFGSDINAPSGDSNPHVFETTHSEVGNTTLRVDKTEIVSGDAGTRSPDELNILSSDIVTNNLIGNGRVGTCIALANGPFDDGKVDNVVDELINYFSI